MAACVVRVPRWWSSPRSSWSSRPAARRRRARVSGGRQGEQLERRLQAVAGGPAGLRRRRGRSGRRSARALGSSTPTKQKLCDVDTSKFKKDPQDGPLPDRVRRAGPDELVGARERGGLQGPRRAAQGATCSTRRPTATRPSRSTTSSSSPPRIPTRWSSCRWARASRARSRPRRPRRSRSCCAPGACEGNSGAVSTVARSYDSRRTLWAEWVVKQLDGKGRVAMLSGIAGVPTAEYQKAAAEKVFAKHPGIEVVAKEYTDWSPTKAKTVAATLVSKDLDAIWSDSGISDLGVCRGLRSAPASRSRRSPVTPPTRS